jgi:ketosteroid isomerase-like protein
MKQIVFATLLALAISGRAYGQCTDADKKKLEEFDRTWGDASVRGDRSYLENVLADDFMNVSPTGTQTKGQTIDAQVKQAEQVRTSSEKPPAVVHDHYVISCTPKTATITHRNIVTTMADGKEHMQYSRSIHFLEKRGNDWKVVSSTGHPIEDGAMLLYLEQDWNEADIAHDAGWYEHNYASDATDVSSRTGGIMGKTESVQDMKNSKRTFESAELSETRVRVEGNTGIVTGINHVKGRDEKGTAFDRWVRFTDTFVKRDGRWFVWATQGTEVKK